MSENKNRINMDDQNFNYFMKQENLITDINFNNQIV